MKFYTAIFLSRFAISRFFASALVMSLEFLSKSMRHASLKLYFIYWVVVLCCMAAGVYYCSNIIDLMDEHELLPEFFAIDVFFLKLVLVFLGSGACSVACYKILEKCWDLNFSRVAIFKKKFKLHNLEVEYQPIVDLRTGSWKGAEALVRWKDNGRLISPALFVPILEQTSAISSLTRWVCTQVIEDYCSTFYACDDLYFSINLSSQDVMDEEFPCFVASLIKKYNAHSIRLVFEVTENIVLDQSVASRNLKRLRSQGHRIALDDFGTGYSSLSYVSTLPLDILKLDRMFISSSGNDTNIVVVAQMASLANKLDLELIVEGVEHSDQVTKLLGVGVKMAQGWLYSKSLSSYEFARGFFSRGIKNGVM